MCILIIKPEGKDVPSKDILKRCYEKNPDGAGICYNYKNKVIIDKGFMNFESFYDEVKQIPKSSTAFIHCRIGTSGGNTQAMTHPYSLCNDYNEMKKIHTKTDFAVAHNGIFNDFNNLEKDVNDTCIFIKRVLYPLHKASKNILNGDFDYIINQLMRWSNKIAIMDKYGNFKKYGNGWLEDNGIYYSNNSYKEYKPVTYSSWNTKSYNPYTNYYDDDFDYIEDYLTKQKQEITKLKEDNPSLADIIDDYVLYGYTAEDIKRRLIGVV